LTQKKRIVIIGATSAMATHCARLWVQNAAVDLVLVGRDLSRLERVAQDLKARSADSTVQTLTASFTDASAIQALVTELAAQQVIDVALIAHGSLGDQTASQNDLQRCQQELETNGVSPVLFAEAFAQVMAKADHGTLAVIGSVAGDRGRKSNYVYGAAKGLVTRYVQGLQHRFAGTNVKVVLIKPGPTETPMTAALTANGAQMASVQEVAQGIVTAIEKGTPVAYVPGKWWLIMMVIRHLPRFIFNKMNI
jgi:decaprenylphospho-beta-D-erythro-pentofuranosid-2-ulose 2-reductase